MDPSHRVPLGLKGDSIDKKCLNAPSVRLVLLKGMRKSIFSDNLDTALNYICHHH